ncbi:DUF134 domain-containing protein [archaeon]|nr:DUF134 domain-containing protein [archaeon]MBT4373746.1 DUF134 domain-containing protein [archaeon]MBT4532212.1 DUF134 domain-containing protein [archaeon]MBT7001436.1 DUF134 domain-containing protein [archaeon]MBT7282764.1 DUF134 domain-containing protein [archaeon]
MRFCGAVVGRPRICRRIRGRPDVTYFKPAGIRMIDLKEVVLAMDEFEAIRLVDFEGIEQSVAGEKMKISQPTLSRLLKSARNKLAGAITNGNAIKIEGGNFKFSN